MTHLPAVADALPLLDIDWSEWLLWALGVAIVLTCLRIYGRLFKRLFTGHGKVWAEPFGLPDLLVVIVLGSWLGGMAVRGFLKAGEERPMTNRDIAQSALLFVIIVAAITFFLWLRKISVVRLLGFRQTPPLRAIGMAVGLLLAAYPFIFLATDVMVQWLGEKAQSQQILEFFTEAAKQSDLWRVVATASVGVFVAPVAEEFLFRGYFYGVLRRHIGPGAALFLSAALFAAIHLNVVAFPALFILALCLTLAYESSGSLLVPMMMHALFNTVTLGKVFLDVFFQQ